MAVLKPDDVFNFMEISIDQRIKHLSLIEELIDEAESFVSSECDIQIEPVTFTDHVLVPYQNFIAAKTRLILMGELFDAFEITKLSENGVEMSGWYWVSYQRSIVLPAQYFTNDYGKYTITAKAGFVDEKTQTLKKEVLYLIKERVAVNSKLWTRVLSTTDGQTEVLIVEPSKTSTDLMKRIRDRRQR